MIELKCKKKILEIKQENDKLMGIHIRRGDYKTFKDGLYYYSDEEFVNWMKIFSTMDKGNFFQGLLHLPKAK